MQILHHFFDPIGDRLLQLLWHLIHLVVTIWYLARGIYSALESYLISTLVLKKYQSLETHKLKYVAVVVESEDAHHTAKIVGLVKWLAAIGVRCVCLYDTQGILKRSKNFILANLNDARLFEEAFENDFLLLDKKYITLEFVSLSDGKEAVAKAANVLFIKYSKSCASGKNQEDQIFTEASMAEALKLVGCRGPEPDLLLVYGPARCHLGFPAWRIRYTEIVHMGPLKSMRYGSLIKAVYKFTMVRQNYGK